jgi:hypothetical protein
MQDQASTLVRHSSTPTRSTHLSTRTHSLQAVTRVAGCKNVIKSQCRKRPRCWASAHVVHNIATQLPCIRSRSAYAGVGGACDAKTKVEPAWQLRMPPVQRPSAIPRTRSFGPIPHCHRIGWVSGQILSTKYQGRCSVQWAPARFGPEGTGTDGASDAGVLGAMPRGASETASRLPASPHPARPQLIGA